MISDTASGKNTLSVLQRGRLYSLTQEDLQPNMVNWLGKQPMNGIPFPTITSTNCLHDGSFFNGDSYWLSWHTSEGKGPYDRLWKTFAAQLLRANMVEYELEEDEQLGNDINVNQQAFRIDGLNYLCNKASIVMPFLSVSKS